MDTEDFRLKDPENIARMINNVETRYPQISRVKLKDIKAGPIDFASLYRIIAYDYKDNITSELFAKAYGERRDNIEISEHIIKDKWERVRYSAMQQRYWNKIEIPSTIFYDLIEKGKKQVLIMEYLDNPFHDLDIIALKSHLSKLKGKFAPEENKKVLSEQIENIAKSILKTMNKIAVYGTNRIDEYKKINERFYVEKPSDVKEYYVTKLGNYAGEIKLLHAIDHGEINVKTAREDMKKLIRKLFDKNVRNTSAKIVETSNEIKRLFSPLIEGLVANERLEYSQGDGYPHHFQYRKFKKGIESAVVDSCRCKLEPEYFPNTKPLLSSLFNFDYNKVQEILLESIVEKEILRADFENRKSNVKGIGDLDTQKIMKHFDIWAILEEICAMGKAASDLIVNKDRHYKLVGTEKIYKNPYLNEQVRDILFGNEDEPVYVPFLVYKAQDVMKILTKNTRDRLELLLDGKACYKLNDNEKKNLEAIKKFCETNIFVNDEQSKNINIAAEQELKTGTG